MARYPVMWLDAFTSVAMGGNPCAVVFEADDLSAARMQAIARELNLSETAFVRRSDVADFGVRYFTPAEEIPLAGHPTIAATQALVLSGRLALTDPLTVVHLGLSVGPIRVEVHSRAGVVTDIVMVQPAPVLGAVVPAAEACAALGLAPDDLLGLPAQVVSTGTPMLMVPVRDQAALRRAHLVPEHYVPLRAAYGFFSPHVFCLPGLHADAATFARHFGLPPDTAEDPFTGSATGCMGAYLWTHGLLSSPRFTAEQGHWMGRPGRASVEVVGPRDAIEAVKVGGTAVCLMRGELAPEGLKG